MHTTQTKQAAVNAQTGPGGSWLQLFNPFSPITGGNDRIPQFIANAFPDNPTAAWLVSKVGASALLAATLAGSARYIQHKDRMHRLKDKNDPASKIESQLNTTFLGSLKGVEDAGKEKVKDKKEKDKDLSKEAAVKTANPTDTTSSYRVEMPSVLNLFDSTWKTALPVSAFLLAGSAAWNGVNKISDKSRNKRLDKAVKDKDSIIRTLMTTRARVAKGTATEEEVSRALSLADTVANKTASLNKTAGGDKDKHAVPRAALAAAGLLAVGLAAASSIAGYRHFSATDENNVKYKALKQGLDRYARAKTQMSPITFIPEGGREYFESIDRDQAPPDVRSQPEITPAKKPISITL